MKVTEEREKQEANKRPTTKTVSLRGKTRGKDEQREGGRVMKKSIDYKVPTS